MMAKAGIALSIPQMPKFLGALIDAPKVQLRYMRTELNRGLKRIRKNFIKGQLHGSPGIHAEGKLSKGKNIFTYVQAKSLPELGGKIGISRILHVHEKGMTITAKNGGKLYLHAKGGSLKPVTAVVSKVVIPKRLNFETQVYAEAPAMLVKVAQAGSRATEVTLRKGLIGGR